MGDGTENQDKKNARFALLIQFSGNPDGTAQIQITSKNEGIADSEVVLCVEAWLEKIKEYLKNQRAGGLRFGAGPDVGK